MARCIAAALLGVIVLTGCGSASAPTATVPPVTSEPAVTQTAPPPTPTTSPTRPPSTPVPTFAPTPTPPPQVFDSAAFLKVFDSTAVLKQYPSVSGAKVGSLYAAAIKADPALGKLLGKEHADANPAKSAPTVLICAGQAPNPDGVTFSQYEDYQGSCAAALPRLIWYINHNADTKALPLLRALVGYIVHNDQLNGPWSDTGPSSWRGWMLSSLQLRADYLDGRCGGPAGLGTC